MRYYYIHTQEDKSLVKTVMAYAKSKEIQLIPIELTHLNSLEVEEGDHILATANVEGLKEVMEFVSSNGLSMGIVPRAEQKELKKTFEFPSSVEKQIEIALNSCSKKLDLLYCNDKLVLQEVVIGEVPPLDLSLIHI